MANTIRPKAPPKPPSKHIKIVQIPRVAWDWEGAKKEYVAAVEPPYGMRTVWLTDLAARYGTTYQNLHNFLVKWDWNKDREEAQLLMKIGEREGEDRARRELGPIVTPDTPTAALSPALQHKLAVDESMQEVDRRQQLALAKESLIADVETVNTKVRSIMERDDLVTFTEKGSMVNQELVACKVAMDIAVRRAQIISTLLGDPKKATPSNVTNNLNLNLPEASAQMQELQATMDRAMQFRPQPLTAFEPHPVSGFALKAPLTITEESTIIDVEVDET